MSRAGTIILRLGVLLFFTLRLTPAAVAQVQSAPPAKPVRVVLTVTDARQPRMYVAGLRKDQVTLLDEGAPREVTSFGQSDQPMSIGLAFDTSMAHHMSKDNYTGLLAATKAAFLNFIKTSDREHHYFIVGFDEKVYLAADWSASPEEVGRGFDRLAGVRPSKKTALYDALHAVLAKASGGANTKRVVILVTGGRDDGSLLKRPDVLDAVRKSDALVYAVGVAAPGSTSFGSSDDETLSKLCSVSGGLASYPRTGTEFYETFERLSVELRNQYTVSFIPGGVSCNGEWRRLSFKADTLDFKGTPAARKTGKMLLSVRAREGYYCSP